MRPNRMSKHATRRVAAAVLTLGLVIVSRPAHAQSGAFCVGDCNGDGAVTVDELVTGVTIALETAPLSACPALNFQEDTVITIDELLLAVDAALNGCPAGSTPALLASQPEAGARDVPRSVHRSGAGFSAGPVEKRDV